MARWEDRRGRTETLERKAGEGIQKDWEPRGNQQHSDEPKPGASQKRCSDTPSANPPGHVTCNDSRSDHEEYRRAKNGKYSPHSVDSTYPLASGRLTGRYGPKRGSRGSERERRSPVSFHSC